MSVLALPSVLWCVLMGVGQAGETYPRGTLVYGEYVRPEVFCPLVAKYMSEVRAGALLYPSLLRRKTPQGQEFEGWLAEKLPQVGRQGGLLEQRFRLREHVRWTTYRGVPVSNARLCADDVVRTVEIMSDELTTPKTGGYWPQILKASGQGAHVAIWLRYVREKDNPYTTFLFPVFPGGLVDVARMDRSTPEVRQPRYFVGPYRLDSPPGPGDTDFQFVTNADYFEGRPKIDKIVLRYNSDAAALFEMLRTRALHALPEVKPNQIENLQRAPYIALDNYNSYSFYFLGFNMDPDVQIGGNKRPNIFNAKGLRQAVAVTLDRSRIAEQVYRGDARLLSGPFPQRSPCWHPDVPVEVTKKGYPDLWGEAQEALEEFGDQPTRRRRYETVILAYQRVPNTDDIFIVCRHIRAQLASKLRSRVKVQLMPLSQRDWYREVYQKPPNERSFHLALERFSMGWDLDISPVFGTDGPLNFMRYSNAYVDAMLGLARIADYDNWVDICRILHYVIHGDYPAVFLWNLKSYAAHNCEEFECKIDPFKFFFNVHTWEYRGEE